MAFNYCNQETGKIYKFKIITNQGNIKYGSKDHY